MRQRSKSCFVAPDEVLKIDEEDNEQNTTSTITSETFDNIVAQVISQIPSNDEEPFLERLAKIKWKKIQIYQHSYKKIKDVVCSSIEKVRKHRILIEVLEDAKLAFKTQSSEADDYKKVINKFHLDAPQNKKEVVRTPFSDFYDQIKHKGVKYNEARSKYKNLEDNEKLLWILKFLGVKTGQKLNLIQYTRAKDILNQQELKIIDEYEEKPKKTTPYNKFVKDYFKDMRDRGTELNSAMLLKQAVDSWRQLPEHEKQKYQEQTGQLKIQYDEDMKHYIDTLPQDRKDELINERKRKKGKVTKEDNKKQKIMENEVKLDKSSHKKDVTPQKISSIKKTSKAKTSSESNDENSYEKTTSKNSKIKKNLQEKSFTDSIDAEGSSPKKNSKNQKKEDGNKFKPNQMEPTKKPFNLKRPPQSMYKFYVLNVFKGPKTSAKSSYKLLTKKEKRKLVEKHKQAEEEFLQNFRKYLNTLSVEEMQELQKQGKFEEEDMSDITESSDGSDE